MGEITINITDMNETVAFWLSNLFKNEAEEARGAAENEKLFAAGSDSEESKSQHEEYAKINTEYAKILEDAHNQVQKFWK